MWHIFKMFFAHDIRLNVCQLQHNKCVVKSPCDLYCVVPFNFLSCCSLKISQSVGMGFGMSSAICITGLLSSSSLGTVVWET